MKFKFFTKWQTNEICCICLSTKKCDQKKNCEELDFTLNPYDGIKDCMKEDYHKRNHGALRQVSR